VSDVIAQPAETMCMKVPTFDTKAAIHSDRYNGMRNGDQGPFISAPATSLFIAPTLCRYKCYKIDILPISWDEMLQSRVIHHLVTKVIYGRFRGQ
jgi:hypothetical protein